MDATHGLTAGPGGEPLTPEPDIDPERDPNVIVPFPDPGIPDTPGPQPEPEPEHGSAR